MEVIIEKEKQKESKIVDKDNAKGELVVMNDDFNTFMHVINCLKRYCGISDGIAEVYTMKIHFEGECVVLKDKKAILEPICENLIESGLSAVIRDTEDKEEE
jgi:ATP-dependent Clp protease adaptor protein ClpS